MKIFYRFRFAKKFIVDDHWSLPFQGGKLQVIEEEGYAVGLEVVFVKQPLEYAPLVQSTNGSAGTHSIDIRDPIFGFVRYQLNCAVSFLECIHNVELSIDDVDVKYQGETLEEEKKINIKSFQLERYHKANPLSFDLLARSVIAAESQDGPKIESTLIRSARKSFESGEFINSFRYSFLLIELLYGDGQFKSASLQASLRRNEEFREIVRTSLSAFKPGRRDKNSATLRIIREKPTVDDVVDHLVERRGFYFHGNIKRRDAWKPDKHDDAESLATLALGIAREIAHKALTPIFARDIEIRIIEEAYKLGAVIMVSVAYKYKEPGEETIREAAVNIKLLGTKITSRTALVAVRQFIQYFEEEIVISNLCEAKGRVIGTGEDVFDLKIHV